MRTFRRSNLSALALLVAASTATAQSATTQSTSTARTAQSGWEFLASSGALVPTGAQRQAIKDAALSTVQLSYTLRSQLVVTSMAGWARSRDLGVVQSPKLSVFTYDVGLEWRAPNLRASRPVALTPFAGLGAGGRSYDYRGATADATHGVSGYAAAGAIVGAGRVRLRIEARDYLASYQAITRGAPAATRNDVVLLAGLHLSRRAR